VNAGGTRRHTASRRRRRLRLELPEGWRVIETSGPGPFVTRAVLESPDGYAVEWSSRRHRKQLGLRRPTEPHIGRRERPDRGGGIGRASHMSWAIGSLFAVGSLCFALGSMPLYFDHVNPTAVAYTFFVGSIFFTSAAYLQYHEAVAAPTTPEPAAPPPAGLGRFLGWAPHRIDWWATTIQLVGTLFFNLSTFSATRADLTLQHEQRLIWAPDVLGSICFLIASWLACSEVCPRLWCRRDRSLGWWISDLNLVGSVAFGVSAVAARYLTTTGVPANISLVNLGTFIGAVCFLAGAALLPVESAREASPSATMLNGLEPTHPGPSGGGPGPQGPDQVIP